MKHIALILSIVFSVNAKANYYEEVQALKLNIINTAQKYEGQGDPELKIQKELESFVQRLLQLNPQPKVQDRLHLLYGVWKQVWGPYEYRKNNRGVDPSLDPKEIYQVISPEGFYYNVSPNLDKKTQKEKNLIYLIGEYTLSKNDLNGLDVKFTKFIGMRNRPQSKEIYDFVDEAERDQLPTQITIVPRIIVKYSFGGGTLREIYTDDNLRILYGTNKKEFKNKYLYIMTKIK